MSDRTPTFGNTPRARISSSAKPRRASSLRHMLAAFCVGVCALVNQSATAQQTEASAEANGALIRKAYDAFSRGDIDTVMAMFAPDIVWHVPGRGPLSRDYRGHAEVLGFFGRFMELSNGTFRLRVDDVLARGDRVVVLCTESAQRGGRSWTAPQVHVWTVKDGKATAFREYEGDEQGDDEFWSSPG
jgi:uncharacterized protein